MTTEELTRLHDAAAAEFLRDVEETIEEVRRERATQVGPVKYLITRDELLAAGALYVPPAWRKSLSAGQEDNSTRQRSLFSDLSGDDDAPPEEQEPTPLDADDDSFADEDD